MKKRKIDPVFRNRICVHDLPNELMAKIFESFQFRDLHMVKRTCKRWKEIANTVFTKYSVVTKGIRKMCYENPILESFQIHFLFSVGNWR